MSKEDRMVYKMEAKRGKCLGFVSGWILRGRCRKDNLGLRLGEWGEVTYFALISVLMLSDVDAEWNGMVGLLDLNDRLNNCAHFVRFRSRV